MSPSRLPITSHCCNPTKGTSLESSNSPAAHYVVAERRGAELDWAIRSADFTGDGRPGLISLADKALVLERPHRWSRPELKDIPPRPRPADGT
ncbi:MAG: hypothetical protein FJ387_24145 [Verrucomicrobia bacterium]|nr:hypothetical protein [Verrucomicrobiota bacterium]